MIYFFIGLAASSLAIELYLHDATKDCKTEEDRLKKKEEILINLLKLMFPPGW